MENSNSSLTERTCSVSVHRSVTAITVVSAVYVVLGVSTNIYSAYALWSRTKPKDRKRGQKLYTLIALVDIIFIVSNSSLLAWRYAGQKYLQIACVGVTILMSLFITVSQALFVLVCIERYRSIACPFRLELGRAFKAGFIVAGTFVSLFTTLPTVFTSGCYCREKCLAQKCSDPNFNLPPSRLIGSTIRLLIAVISYIAMWSLVLKAIKLLFKEEGFVTKAIIASRKRKLKGSLRTLYLNLSGLGLCTIPYAVYNFIVDLKLFTTKQGRGTWIVQDAPHGRIYLEYLVMAFVLIKPMIHFTLFDDCAKEREMVKKAFCLRKLDASSK